MKPYYICHYDGKTCDKVEPRFDENKKLIKEPNEVIKEKYKGIVDEITLNYSWDVCDKCGRNCCISGFCFGKLAKA